jgi:transposase
VRKSHSKDFKAKVALAALKGDKSMAELSSEYGVHANMITKWRKEAKDGLAKVFGGSGRAEVLDLKTRNDELYTKIGRIQVENDWLRKKLDV